MSARFQRSRTGDRGGSTAMVDRLLDAPTPRVLPPVRGRRGRGGRRVLAAFALGGFFLVALILVVGGLSSGVGSGKKAARPAAQAKPSTSPPAPKKNPARPKPALAAPIPI